MAKGRKLKIFSFFAGCGILDLGFEKAGYDIEFVNEFKNVNIKFDIFSCFYRFAVLHNT